MASPPIEGGHIPGLVQPKEYDINDTNVELIGSDLDHQVKYNSAASEPAWNDGRIGTQAGLFVWRIENFAVVAVPKDKYGQFFEGDSYIVLHSQLIGKPGDGDGEKKKLIHDVFFWLGAHTTQDEAGTAAYKTVELDEFLHGAATQHREVQAYPSDEFVALFPRLTVRRGGIASGFRHVEQNAPKTETLLLLRVFKHAISGGPTRRDSVVVHEVEPTWKSLDEEDVFILDQGDRISVWQGRKCSPMEKAKAAQIVHDMIEGRRVKVNVEVLSQTESRSRAVLRALGAGDEDDVGGGGGLHTPRPMLASSAVSEKSRRPRRLFRLSDASGQLEFGLVKDSAASADPIARSDLNADDVFLLDDAGKTIWVWEGSRASRAEKAMWLRVAQSYIRKLQSEIDSAGAYVTPVAKVQEGSESPAFLRAVEAV
ncbi:hypothetical protein B0H63DRAFT_473747 [Podospora didyma]|uniref:Gelsolin-like domain-containing protein n=1 Tax=Podospora didyma TaxID=330526 RepID=A0AAE0NQI1_9PEZI|nr:hypothetical protein B0H63DRAFT_473747 [Podospora didyma]